MSDFVFDGFEPANTTPVPDVLFDVLLAELNESELKVLLYIIRRTSGFKKPTDAISLTQFQKGIKKRATGEILDRGCGVKDRATIIKALASLEKKGIIQADKTNDPSGDKATSVYRIRFRTEVVGKTNHLPYIGSGQNQPPWFAKPTTGSGQNQLGVVGDSNPQETVLQLDSLQETDRQEGTLGTSAIATVPAPAPDLSEDVDTLKDAVDGAIEHLTGKSPVDAAMEDSYSLTQQQATTTNSSERRQDGLYDSVHDTHTRAAGRDVAHQHDNPDPTDVLHETTGPHQRVPSSDRVSRATTPGDAEQSNRAALTTNNRPQEQVTNERRLNETSTQTATALRRGHGAEQPARAAVGAPAQDTAAGVAAAIGSEQPPTKRRRKPTPPKDETQQARIDRVYDCFDRLMQEVMKDPTSCYARDKTADDAIEGLLKCHPTEEWLQKVYRKLWNKPRDPKTGFKWSDNMSIKAVCRQFATTRLAMQGEDNAKNGNRATPTEIGGYRVDTDEDVPELVFIGPASARKGAK